MEAVGKSQACLLCLNSGVCETKLPAVGISPGTWCDGQKRCSPPRLLKLPKVPGHIPSTQKMGALSAQVLYVVASARGDTPGDESRF